MTQPAAKAYCESIGSLLVSIHSLSDQRELQFQANAHRILLDVGTERTEWWLGITDSDTEDEWQWLDGTDTDYGFNGKTASGAFPWSPGEPNDFKHTQDGEDCLAAQFWAANDKYLEFTWNDRDCNANDNDNKGYPLCYSSSYGRPPTMSPTAPTPSPTTPSPTEDGGKISVKITTSLKPTTPPIESESVSNPESDSDGNTGSESQGKSGNGNSGNDDYALDLKVTEDNLGLVIGVGSGLIFCCVVICIACFFRRSHDKKKQVKNMQIFGQADALTVEPLPEQKLANVNSVSAISVYSPRNTDGPHERNGTAVQMAEMDPADYNMNADGQQDDHALPEQAPGSAPAAQPDHAVGAVGNAMGPGAPGSYEQDGNPNEEQEEFEEEEYDEDEYEYYDEDEEYPEDVAPAAYAAAALPVDEMDVAEGDDIVGLRAPQHGHQASLPDLPAQEDLV